MPLRICDDNCGQLSQRLQAKMRENHMQMNQNKKEQNVMACNTGKNNSDLLAPPQSGPSIKKSFPYSVEHEIFLMLNHYHLSQFLNCW